MPSPFPPIEDYAFLSDCHTGALVAPDGSVDWLCVPSFDAPSVFGSLLDRGAGAFRLGPFGINVPTARAYEPGTNVLVTTWKTPTGWIEVRDALTIGPPQRDDAVTPHTRPPADWDADHLLVRTVRGIEGTVQVELICDPNFDYGRTPGEWTMLDDDRHTADATGAGVTIRLRTDMALGIEGDQVRARHTIGAGDDLYVALSWEQDLAASSRSTRRRNGSTSPPGSGGCGSIGLSLADHRWRDPLQRSALTIKGLTYAPTGATVAALTTSLPETPGGERNWDYRFSWMRDSTFTLQALHYLNLDWEAEEFIQFIADLEPNDDGAMQIMYGIDGHRGPTESTRDDLSGYAGARPVRIGNGAFDQRQNDVFGAVLDSILLHTRRSERLPRRIWPVVEAQATCAAKVWTNPDQGIWEARGAPQHYVSSKLMCWVAMDRAAKLAAIRGVRRPSRPIGRRPPRRSKPTSSSMASGRTASSGSTTTPTRSTPRRCSRRALRVPPGDDERLQLGPRDRERPHRGRLRVQVQDRRDGRRAVGQGGQLPDLLVLARLGARGRRRATASARPDGAAAPGVVAARAVRRGVRYEHGAVPGELSPGVLPPGVDRGGRPARSSSPNGCRSS